MPVNKVKRHGSFAPLSARYADDSAVIEAGEKAELLYVRGLAWCAGHLNDGFISDAQLTRVGANMRDVRARARKLCDVGLWQHAEGGYQVVAWLSWNKSAAEIAGDAAKDAGRKAPTGSDSAPPPPGKQSGERGAGARIPNGNRPESERSPDGFRPLAHAGARAPYKVDTDTEDKSSAPTERARRAARTSSQPALTDPPDDEEYVVGTYEPDETSPPKPDLSLVPASPSKYVDLPAGPRTKPQRINDLATVYYEGVDKQTKFAGNRAVLEKFVDGKWDDQTIRSAVIRLIEDKRELTANSLRQELNGPPKRRGQRSASERVARTMNAG